MYQFLEKDKIPVLGIKDCKSLCRDDANRHIIRPETLRIHGREAREYENLQSTWEKTPDGKRGKKPPQPSWYRDYAIKLKMYRAEVDEYISSNAYQYYLCVNSWLLLTSDIAPFGSDYILSVVRKKGFLGAIDHFSEVASAFISGKTLDMADQALYDQIVNAHSLRTMQWARPQHATLNDPDALFLLVCRYPKRFTPSSLISLTNSTFAGFQQDQFDDRDYDSDSRIYNLSRPLVRMVRDVIQTLIPWKTVCKEIRNTLSEDYNNLVIPSGSSPLGSRLSDKVKALYESWPMAFSSIFGEKPILVNGQPRLSRWDYQALTRVPATINLVPKSARTLRTIAMEYPQKYAPAKRVALVLDKYCPKCIPLHDQSISQDMIQVGSRAGDRASIDSTSASDRITYKQFAEVFPIEFTALIFPLLPHYYVYNGIQYPLYGMATAGNPLTFILESIFFAALAITGTIIGSGFSLSIRKAADLVTVYGDDVICVNDYFQTVTEVMEKFHVKVNESKSYTSDELFQEACGMDTIDGVDVATFYWPRKAFTATCASELTRITTDSDENGSSITSFVFSLISHQQNVATISTVAATFLLNEIKDAIPDVGIAPLYGKPELPWMPYTYSKTHLPPIWDGCSTEAREWYDLHTAQLSREVYLTPHVSPKSFKRYEDIPPYLSVFCYTQYLKEGPMYTDPLLELLGVSTSRLSQLTTGFEVRTKFTD